METFAGRHYETGTIANALAALGATDPKTGKPYSEAMVLGASGGIAFGYFTFEYKGHLPHVALLTRNTFAPFERALEHLAIRRETRETVQAAKGEGNLRRELDAGNAVIVWADAFSMPYRGLPKGAMWAMRPVLVVGQEENEFLLADGSSQVIRISAEELQAARAVVKKDRFRTMTLERPDESALPERLVDCIRACVALALDKPPAGSANNFGIAGMRHFAKVLTDVIGSKSWETMFAPGPRLAQALAGTYGQPGVWDWIQTWGTGPSADRGTYATFLREAAVWTGISALGGVADEFDRSSEVWNRLAQASMPNEVHELLNLRALKSAYRDLWFERGRAMEAGLTEIRREMAALFEKLSEPSVLAPYSRPIREAMAAAVLEIAEIEEGAMRRLREAVA
ncbi:MAG: BtrH N-terminal domain-containing protein [Fimbriimonas sp.]